MIDFKKFKKVSSDKHTTTLKHDDGHEFKVVHSALSPKLRKDIQKIPLAEGGEVPSKMSIEELSRAGTDVPPENQKVQMDNFDFGVPNTIQSPSGMNPGQPNYMLNDAPPSQNNELGDAVMGGMRGVVDQAVQKEEQKAQEPAAPEHTGLSVLSGTPPTTPAVDRINQLMQPDPNISRQVQQAAQHNIDENQRIGQQFQMKKAQIDAEHQSLVHDIMNKHIDMSDYWKANDKGAAALGALLGGMGSGLTHLANPVPGMIANSQENFLKAEMANMDNPKSLLAAVQAQYGDNKDSADIMRIISNEALGSQIQKVMAPLNSANAQANAAKVQMELMQNSEQLKQQIAMRQALTSGGQGQSGNPADSARKLFLMKNTGMIDEKQYDQANKELGIAEKTMNAHQAIDKIVDEAMKLQTVGSRLGSPIQSAQKLDALWAQLVPLVLEASPSKRLTPESIKSEIDPLKIRFTTGKGTAEEIRTGLHDVVDTHADQTPVVTGMQSFGISAPKYNPSVTVISPNGQSGKVPRSNLQRALEKGFKQVQ